MSVWSCFGLCGADPVEEAIKFSMNKLYHTVASIVTLKNSEIDVETTYSAVDFDSIESEIVCIKTTGPSTVMVSKIGKIIIVAPYNMDMRVFNQRRVLKVTTSDEMNADEIKIDRLTQCM